jgi:hypothetical protein
LFAFQWLSLDVSWLLHVCCVELQSLKANAEGAPADLRLNSNYITGMGQVALKEAVDMVYDMAKGKMTTIHF